MYVYICMYICVYVQLIVPSSADLANIFLYNDI